jgi:putative MATE family efflux protein
MSKKVGRDLTNGPIMSSLMMFAMPIVITDLIQQLYSMVDLMIIGRFVGNVGTVGVNTGGEIADFLMPVATAFAAAGQIYIAQLAGAKKYEEQKNAIGTFITMMLSASLVLMVLTIVLTKPILSLLNCPAESLSQATQYMVITAIGLPFIYGYNAVCGVLRGMGESQRPLVFIIIAAVVNIFLDIILVAVFDLKAAGTAIATVISQIAAFTASFVYMYKNKETFEFEPKFSYFKFHKEHLEVLLKLGLPQALRSVLVRASMLWVNANINACGSVASGTNGIGNKLQKFLEIFTASMSQASAAMVGQNLGAKKYDRAKKAVLSTLLVSIIFGACISLLIYIFPTQTFGIFTKDPDVKAFGVFYIHMLCVHIMVSAITSSHQSMVIGSGAAALNFVIGILDGVVCKIGLSLLFVNVIFKVNAQTDWFTTALGYFWGTGLSRVLPAIVCMIYFYSGSWKKKALLKD